jgi:two-component system, NtrC family, sensor kinase
VTRNAWVGVMALHQCNKPRVWMHEDKELMTGIAEQLGLAISQAQLFHELTARKNKLANTLEELQRTQMQLIQSEKMAILGQFVAGIAHEVNTPLGGLMSNNETLQRVMEKLDTAPPEHINDLLQNARELLELNQLASERIRETVVNLRNFARLDENEQKEANLEAGLESTLKVMRHAFPQNLEIQRDFPEKDAGRVKCFPGLVNQVFMNLIINAFQAMTDVEYPILTLAIHSAVQYEDKSFIQVTIGDNGCGIPQNVIGRIFDPGFTTKNQGIGTGLGLALCYQIMEKHSGFIKVTSTPENGTQFSIYLPA